MQKNLSEVIPVDSGYLRWRESLTQLATLVEPEIKGCPMKVEPYLFFNGRCDEAIAFYKEALGAEVTMLMRVHESPDPVPPGALPEGFDNKVMHANLRIGNTMLMLSDGNSTAVPAFKGFSLSLSVADAAEAERTYSALLPGGRVVMPLGRTFWSPAFGMLEDRFGVGWMVIAP